MRRVILPIVAVALLATPALAQGRARCDADDNRPGLHVEFGVSFGNTKRDRETDEQMPAR
jgi:hypothetical protein